MNYYEMKHKSNMSKELLDYALNSEPWYDHYNFKAKPIPQHLMFIDPFFTWLLARYNFIGGILKLDPYTCYDWHIDTRRGVGINMSLTPFDRSICAFAPNKDGAVFKIDELKYKPMTYYLFNTQVEHTVYNFETTRFIMSIEFAKNKDELSFNQLVKDIKDNYEKDSTK
jgi:hypothetical protein